MKLTEKIIDKDTKEYYLDGVLKYERRKDSDGDEIWSEFDKIGNRIHYKTSDGFEEWREFDQYGNIVYCKDSNGDESWYEYDQHGNRIHYKYSNKDKQVDIEPFTFKEQNEKQNTNDN